MSTFPRSSVSKPSSSAAGQAPLPRNHRLEDAKALLAAPVVLPLHIKDVSRGFFETGRPVLGAVAAVVAVPVGVGVGAGLMLKGLAELAQLRASSLWEAIHQEG